MSFVTTLDKKLDVSAQEYGNNLRFTIQPHGMPSTLANTRHYAFRDEAVSALLAKGYEYAEELVAEAIAAKSAD